jgi:phage-related protein
MWEVEFYTKPNHRTPTQEFLDGQTKQDLVFIDRAIKRLETYGLKLGRPHSGTLRDHINELRIRTNHGLFRLLYFWSGKKFIITHGIQKDTRDVPTGEIDKAIEYMNEYYSRFPEG